MADKTTATAATANAKSVTSFSLPFAYRAFFLVVEPVAALLGAYYAYFGHTEYIRLTDVSTASSPSLPLRPGTAMARLANMYLFSAVTEALVLRSTSELRIWKTVLFCLLVNDFGHLFTLREFGLQIYWDVSQWTPVDWGSVAFVYLCVAMRVAFLADLGLGMKGKKLTKRRAA